MDDKGQMACKSPGERPLRWLIVDNCKRCNKINDCATSVDELNCPAYVSPSFEMPVICCLVILILGVLLHLGWKAVTKTAVDEARNMERIGAAGRQLEEAVDLIIHGTIEGQPFPEASYEIVHNHCGGIDLLIGARHGKSAYVWQINIFYFNLASYLFLSRTDYQGKNIQYEQHLEKVIRFGSN